MSTIYIVMGSVGEYSDRVEWPVVALTTEGAAKARVVAASDEARVLCQWEDAEEWPWCCAYGDGVPEATVDTNLNRYRERCSASSAVRYWYAPVELEDERRGG